MLFDPRKPNAYLDGFAIGLKGTIGKGYRGQPVKDALRQHTGVYFGSIGGAGAVLGAAGLEHAVAVTHNAIKSARIITISPIRRILPRAGVECLFIRQFRGERRNECRTGCRPLRR